MIKIFLCVLLVILCAFAGYLLTLKYKKRKQFTYDLYSFNERLISEVNFTRIPLSVFFFKYEYGLGFSTLLKDIKLKNFEKVSVDFPYLTTKQKQLVGDYFLMLGKSDYKSQSEFLKNYRVEIEKEKTSSFEEYKKFSALYVKLGFLFGLILAILLI